MSAVSHVEQRGGDERRARDRSVGRQHFVDTCEQERVIMTELYQENLRAHPSARTLHLCKHTYHRTLVECDLVSAPPRVVYELILSESRPVIINQPSA